MAQREVVPGPEPQEQEREERLQPEKKRSYFQAHPGAKWVVLAVLVLIAVGGYLAWVHFAGRETTDDAQIDGNIVPVASRVSGWVTEINVKDNQVVKAGTVLVRLDPKDYQVELDRAQAELANAEASARAAHVGVPLASATTTSELRNAEAALAAAQQEVEAANARVAEAQANYGKAAADAQRYSQLVQKNEIPRQTYETAVANEKAAQATVSAAQAAVATAQSHVQQAEAQVQGAETAPQQVAVTRARAGAASAAVQRAQAAVEQARLNLQYTTITAPVDGVVSKKQNVQLGQIVQPGQPLMAIVPLEDIWVTANYKENQLNGMHPGQSATIHLDAYDRDYNGHVESIGPATGARFSLLPPENATGNYVKVVQRVPVRLAFEKGQNTEHLLRPGMSVVATVFLK
jgi:membrane fusion protein (multidrug efflux system)